jgi:tagatose-1,6-bisphosphate aldolase non-catalytic subunit AgaZ/GatZ
MENLFAQIQSTNKCLLGAGPMSTNSIRAVMEISDNFKIPIQLIASRRQIDSDFHGGGYVNNWSTEDLYNHVSKNMQGNLVYLSRDHSGPWQGYYEVENNLGIEEAMTSCKKSLESDIDNGFKFLHLDPCVDIHQENIEVETILKRLFELYGHIFEYSKGLNGIYVEVGTDLQGDKISTLEETEYILEKLKNFTLDEINHSPTFYVIQNGTKVLETENVGEYKDKILHDEKFKSEIQSLTQLIKDYGYLSKAHNCDYLEIETLNSLAVNGINGVNIAPEYGVIETKAIISLCQENGLTEELENFLQISYDSGKWEKWLKPKSNLSDSQKSILSGHYVFSTPEFLELKEIISSKLNKSNINFENVLYETVYKAIKNSLTGLNWIKNG